MREVEKEIRQLILEEEDMIQIYRKAKNKEMEQYHNGIKSGLIKSLGLMLQSLKEKQD